MKTVKRGTFALVLLGMVGLTASRLLQRHDDAFSPVGLLKAQASELRETIVAPHLDQPLEGGQSVVWCATFQLAWNEACDLVGADLHFSNGEPPMVSVLNKRSFTKQSIDDSSYVVVADFVKNGVFERIARELEDTFGGRATPNYVPPENLTPRPQDLVAYSYLFKNLEFPVPFERIDAPLWFSQTAVPCFGIGETFKPKHIELRDQLRILDYQNQDDFVLELETKSPQDQFILAKVKPAATLDSTIHSVLTRIAAADPVPPLGGDILKIPKLNFDITRRYQELEGKRLVARESQLATDLAVLSAVQNIRFQLDEEGVRLRSESHISFGCGGAAPPATRHTMVFDKPFLMMLKRRSADVPYLALWIETPEILAQTD